MKLSKIKITNKGLYWGLILTFFIIYICVGFVSTLHAITFFQMANSAGLAVLLALAFEVGQSSVLFSILMAGKNDQKYLPWFLMFLLTALQVTGNVFASFKHIMTSGNLDWQYFQKSILFGVQAPNPEMYQVIISWMQGALLPIVALGLTALVAQKINLIVPREEKEDDVEKEISPEIILDQPKIVEQSLNENNIDNIIERVKEGYKKLDESNIPLANVQSSFENIKPQSEFSLDEPIPQENIPKPDEVNTYYQEKEKKKEANNNIVHAPPADILQQIAASGEPIVSEQFEKEIIIPKKRGRPPKQKDNVVELKKVQEPLQNEDVKVPEKQKRFVNPLKRKDKKIKPLKNLKEFNKPSTGDEIIQIIQQEEKERDKDTINNAVSSILGESEVTESIPGTPYIKNGVEVIDARAVPKEEVKKNLNQI